MIDLQLITGIERPGCPPLDHVYSIYRIYLPLLSSRVTREGGELPFFFKVNYFFTSSLPPPPLYSSFLFVSNVHDVAFHRAWSEGHFTFTLAIEAAAAVLHRCSQPYKGERQKPGPFITNNFIFTVGICHDAVVSLRQSSWARLGVEPAPVKENKSFCKGWKEKSSYTESPDIVPAWVLAFVRVFLLTATSAWWRECRCTRSCARVCVCT